MMHTDQPMLISRRDRSISLVDLMPAEPFYRPKIGHTLWSMVGVGALLYLCMTAVSLLLPLAVLCGLLLAHVATSRVSHREAIERNQEAVELLNSGRVDEAAEIFEALSKGRHGTPSHAVYVFNRAVAFTLQGRPQRAYSLFNAVLRSRAFHGIGTRAYRPLLHVEIGTCLALMGEFEAARSQCSTAMTMLTAEQAGRLLLLDVMLMSSGGNHEYVVDLFGRVEPLAQTQLRRPMLRAAHLVHAHAIRNLGRPDEARRLVRALDLEPGELDWFVASRPQMLDLVPPR